MNACCLFFPLVIGEPVLYLEHVGGDWLQLGGHRQLWLNGDVDHGVVPACLPEREVLVGVPLVDVPGQVGEELGECQCLHRLQGDRVDTRGEDNVIRGACRFGPATFPQGGLDQMLHCIIIKRRQCTICVIIHLAL